MVKASKSAQTQMLIETRQVILISNHPMNKKRIQQIIYQRHQKCLQARHHGRRQQLYTLNKNGIFLPHLGFLEQWRDGEDRTQLERARSFQQGNHCSSFDSHHATKERPRVASDLRTPCERSKSVLFIPKIFQFVNVGQPSDMTNSWPSGSCGHQFTTQVSFSFSQELCRLRRQHIDFAVCLLSTKR